MYWTNDKQSFGDVELNYWLETLSEEAKEAEYHELYEYTYNFYGEPVFINKCSVEIQPVTYTHDYAFELTKQQTGVR